MAASDGAPERSTTSTPPALSGPNRGTAAAGSTGASFASSPSSGAFLPDEAPASAPGASPEDLGGMKAMIRRRGGGRAALLEALHAFQERDGYLRADTMQALASALQLPASEVLGTASFYHHFRFHPPGRHQVAVCTGTACHLDGGARIVSALASRLGLAPGETRSDGAVSLDTVRCLGTCGLAPLIVLDGRVASRLTLEDAVALVEEALEENGPPDSNLMDSSLMDSSPVGSNGMDSNPVREKGA